MPPDRNGLLPRPSCATCAQRVPGATRRSAVASTGAVMLVDVVGHAPIRPVLSMACTALVMALFSSQLGWRLAHAAADPSRAMPPPAKVCRSRDRYSGSTPVVSASSDHADRSRGREQRHLGVAEAMHAAHTSHASSLQTDPTVSAFSVKREQRRASLRGSRRSPQTGRQARLALPT